MASRKSDSKTSTSGILIVDDHPVVRDHMRALVDSQPDMRVCGEAENGEQAWSVIQSSRPDLAIVDLSLKGDSGLDLIKEMKVGCPKLLVLVLSMHDESVYAPRAIRAGARGYITKQEAPMKILHAIRCVLSGDTYLSEETAARVLRMTAGGREAHAKSSIERLTDRELQVFLLIGRGRSMRQIADELHLDAKTIETYRCRIELKLGINNARDLLQHAIPWAHGRGDSV